MTASGASLSALASCHEQQGKTASAWAEFLEASTMAHHEKRFDVEASAKQRAASVEGRLSTLAVRVAPPWDIPGLDVRRDGIALVRATWRTPAPVDPGEHRVEVTAPGKLPWRRVVIVRPVAGGQTVDIGPLEDAPQKAIIGTATLTSAAVPGTSFPIENDHPVDLSHPGSAQRAIGLLIAGVGVAGVGVGTYFGIRTLDQSDSARRACPQSPCSDRAAIDSNDQAKTSATISTVSLAGGGGLLLLGSILFFTAPSAQGSQPTATAPPRVKPTFDIAATPAFSGLRVAGDF